MRNWSQHARESNKQLGNERNRQRQRPFLAPSAVIICLVFIRVVVWAFSAEGQFTLATGFLCPSTARIVATGDDYGGFPMDGEFYVVLECDRDTIQHWLADSPFWFCSHWRRGPVPGKIGYHCRFGSEESSGCSTLPNGSQKYLGGSDEIRKLLSSPQVWYAAKNRCPTLPYHSGNLLIIDAENCRVWYSVWKG